MLLKIVKWLGVMASWVACCSALAAELTPEEQQAQRDKAQEKFHKALQQAARHNQAQALLRQRGILCQTRILVTKPQTVSFYVEKVRQDNLLGTTLVGQWLNDTRHCIYNQPIVAVTWDKNGKAQTYTSQVKKKTQTYNNMNKPILVQYPRDFAKAPTTDTSVLCKMQLLNNSKQYVHYYAGRAWLGVTLTQLDPWQSRFAVTPCFKDKPLTVHIRKKTTDSLIIYRYRTKKVYSDINTIPVVSFPNDFTELRTWVIPMSAEWLRWL